ncbi:MAG: hypothetical protein AAF591_23635 [Verrucomicrobiota bacterium]
MKCLLVILCLLLLGCKKRVVTDATRAQSFLGYWLQTEDAKERWNQEIGGALDHWLEGRGNLDKWLNGTDDRFQEFLDSHFFGSPKEVKKGVLVLVIEADGVRRDERTGRNVFYYYCFFVRPGPNGLYVDQMVSGGTAINKLFMKEAGISFGKHLRESGT